MKYLFPLTFLVLASCSAKDNQSEEVSKNQHMAITDNTRPIEDVSGSEKVSFYDLSAVSIDGEEVSMTMLEGKRILIVNTASECGYTPQYAQLQELFDLYGGEDFTIVGFPSNNFGGQEPGSEAEIKSFCTQNYGVSFMMMSKVDVKGNDQHPVYSWLTSASENGVEDAEVKWNFHKFLVDENGQWIAEYPSGVSPLDDRIVEFAQGQ